jgi:hypothetical protein
MGEKPVRAEPGEEVVDWDLHHPSERSEAETPEQIDQRLSIAKRRAPALQCCDRQGSKETGAHVGFDDVKPFADQLSISSKASCKETIGNADSTRRRCRTEIHVELLG